MDELDRRILERMQSDFPLVERPFAALAGELRIAEQELLERVNALRRDGLIRRIGPVLDPAKVGRVGVLAAMAVPERRIEVVAAAVSASEAVTHSYLRIPRHGRCPYNLWFTLSGESWAAVADTLRLLEGATGLGIAALPARRTFKIGVRFSFADEAPDG